MGRLYRPNPAEVSRYGNARARTTATANPIVSLGASWWYDAASLSTGSEQSVTDRIGLTKVLQRGSTTGVDSADPTITLGARKFWSFDGADDRLQHVLADTPASGTSLSLIILCKTTSTGGFGVMWSSETGYDNGIMLVHSHPTFSARCGSGTSSSISPGAGTANDNTWRAVGIVVTAGAPSTFKVYERVAGFGSSRTAAAWASGAARWGMRGFGANQFAGDISAAVMFPTALSLSDMNTVSDYLLAGGY